MAPAKALDALQPGCPMSMDLFKSLFSSSSSATMDVRQLHTELDGSGTTVLVDVRSPAEFASGHVPGAVNIPLPSIGTTTELEVHRKFTIHLICQSGARSGRAQRMLDSKGFTTINVVGGTGAWRATGLAVE